MGATSNPAYESVTAGCEERTEVSESRSVGSWRLWNDLQSAAAVSDKQGRALSTASAGAVSHGCIAIRDSAGEWAARDVAGALVDADRDRRRALAGGSGLG